MAWRLQGSLSLRTWLGLGSTDLVPVHKTLSNTSRRLSLRAHRDVFRWVLALCGRTVGIDASTIEANVALKAWVRWGSGKDYQQFLGELLRAAGVKEPTSEDRLTSDGQEATESAEQQGVVQSARPVKARAQAMAARPTLPCSEASRMTSQVPSEIFLRAGSLVLRAGLPAPAGCSQP